MKNCPACHAQMDDSAVVCSDCLAKAQGLTGTLNRRHLFLAAHQAALLFALFLFVKGCWMAFSEASYSSFTESMGLPPASPGVHYVAALFASVAAILYGVAWIGGAVRARWGYPTCAAALVVFVVGQVITRFAALGPDVQVARAVAFIVLWSAVPMFQLIGLTIGEDPTRVATAP